MLSDYVPAYASISAGVEMLSLGFQSLWQSIARKIENNPVKIILGAEVKGIKRTETASYIEYNNSDGTAHTLEVDYVVMAVDLNRFFSLLVTDPSDDEKRLFGSDGFSTSVLSTTLFESPSFQVEKPIELWLRRMSSNEGRVYYIRNSDLTLYGQVENISGGSYLNCFVLTQFMYVCTYE